MLVFFTNLSLMEFQVRYLALFLYFFSKKWLRVVLNGKSEQEYPVNAGVPLGFLVGPTLLVGPSWWCLYVDVILSVIRHLICDTNFNWLLNLNLIYETLWIGESGLLISMLGKLNWFCLTGFITMVLLLWKCMGLFYRKIIFYDAGIDLLF